MGSRSSERTSSAWAGHPPPTVRWKAWPLRDRWWATPAVLGACILVAGLVYLASQRIHLAIFAAVLLALAGWRLILPVKFDLDQDGVHQSIGKRYRCIPWTEIGHYEIDKRGVFFSPFKESCPTDAMRSVYIPWGAHKDEIMSHINFFLDPPEDEELQ